MRSARILLFALAAVGLVGASADAAPEGWHTSMKDGLAAAARSSKPLLVVTGWSPGT